MKCLRCQNEDPRFFYKDHGLWYCRKCVQFSRLDVGLRPLRPALSRKSFPQPPVWKYELTPKQKQVSQEILHHLMHGKDVFLYAATGAGKTECTIGAIHHYLKQGKKVGFAISRRQVVLEIRERLQAIFPFCHVIAVAQGFTAEVDGDLIVCTMHQLYRYPFSFDLLIMDEIDAFPFTGDPVLHAIADQACTGQTLCLSATPDRRSLQAIEKGEMEVVTLFQRPHGHGLPVPTIHRGEDGWLWMRLIVECRQMIRQDRQILLFVPTRQDAFWMYQLFRFFVKTCYVHSALETKDQVIRDFRERKTKICITTTLLERGIKLPSVQVIVWQGQHSVFTTASLVQIFGRAGRSFQDPDGKGVCLCRYITPSVKECVQLIQRMNDSVPSV